MEDRSGLAGRSSVEKDGKSVRMYSVDLLLLKDFNPHSRLLKEEEEVGNHESFLL